MANFYTKKIENCMDCDNHKVERIWTPGLWETWKGMKNIQLHFQVQNLN